MVDDVKIIAMYLPQFYETEDNNKWWGKGFTDWVSAQNAKSLFEGHYQPHIPLNNNYYNLLNKQTMLEQQKLMAEFGIDGMCFYHYWFKDGRQTLEKPAENLLAWTDIDMPFCFSWANESWTRTWSNLDAKNVWVQIGESKEEMINNPSGILLEQDYGNEDDWIKHFQYLKPFFCDSRYIKVDNKPIFMIYRPNIMTCFEQMRHVWDKMAKECGFDGIYFIACNSLDTVGYDKVLIHEPQYTITEMRRPQYSNDKNVCAYYKYEEIWNRIISRQFSMNNIAYGGFVGYDDTPRRSRAGTVIDGASPEVFKKYLSQLLKKNELKGNDLVFINAWNEWGEGMHLEPDAVYKYDFLQALREAKNEYKTVRLNISSNIKSVGESDKLKRYECYWRTLNQWMILKEKGIKLGNYLFSKGYKKIIIYGMGMLGKHLIEELKNSSVDLVCGIDKNADNMVLPIPAFIPEKTLYDDADLIIISIVQDYELIRQDLLSYTDCEIVSLTEVLKNAESYQ